MEQITTTTGNAMLARWPTVAAVLFAGFVVLLGADRGLAFVVAVSALVYLGAAVLGRGGAWPVFVASFVAVTVADVLGAEPLVIAELAAAAFLAAGALGHRQPGFGRQALGMLVFGISAAVALLLDPVPGALLVAGGLIGHGVWDVVHHRRNEVVPRPYAEFCAVIDFLLGAAILVQL